MKRDECCPKFDPGAWDEKILEWENKSFVKSRVLTLFYAPLNYGFVMKNIYQKVEKAGAKVLDNMVLSANTSLWKMDVFAAVDGEVEGVENVTMSGKFFSKVYEGPYMNMKSWIDDFDLYVKQKSMNIGKMYMWYTTCPKCSKKWGKNYVVIVGEVK